MMRSANLCIEIDIAVCWCRASAYVQFDGPGGTRHRRDAAISRRTY